MTIALGFVRARRPSGPPKRPYPLPLTPPNGRSWLLFKSSQCVRFVPQDQLLLDLLGDVLMSKEIKEEMAYIEDTEIID